MQRLVYRSTATGATDSLLNMATILAESQRNNERDDLTGALAAHANQFIQVVEGRAESLDRLLSRLSADPRHKDLTVIDRSPIDTRLFEGWRMAHARFSPALLPALDHLVGSPSPDHVLIIATLHKAAQDATAP